MSWIAVPPQHAPVFLSSDRQAGRPRFVLQSRRQAVKHGRQRRRIAWMDVAALVGQQELEREQLAQWMHDQIGGLVVQLRLAFGNSRMGAPTLGATESRARIDALLAELASKVRRLSFTLAPPAWHDDLHPALAAIVEELGQRNRMQVKLNTEGLPHAIAAMLSDRHLTVACRVVRELVLNVIKHAEARHVHIRAVLAAGQLCIHVHDDGCGESVDILAAGGLGLRSARAQLQALGGRLVLKSTLAQGTCATLMLPLRAPGASRD